MLAILKKELKVYFFSPIGYIFIGIFLLTASLFFVIDVFNTGGANFEYLFFSLATVLTFITPIITMRMFSEEKKDGTDQLLFTSPQSLTSIVLGKFLSATIVLIISILLTFLYYIILTFLGTPNFLTSISTAFGFTLLGMAYISFGMFASSITESQVISAITTIVFFVFTWFLPNVNDIFEPISLISKFYDFSYGQFSISEIIYFITFSLLFICLTILLLQRRKSLK